MAQLDYATLAEFAKVDAAGLLTVVGGGFDHLQVNAPGLVHQIFVVIRFKLDDDEDSAAFEVKVVPPDKPEFELLISGSAQPGPRTRAIPGNLGALTVMGLGLPITTPGRYTVQVRMSGDVVRDLPFEVELMGEAAS